MGVGESKTVNALCRQHRGMTYDNAWNYVGVHDVSAEKVAHAACRKKASPHD
jgi:hypothetical protein